MDERDAWSGAAASRQQRCARGARDWEREANAHGLLYYRPCEAQVVFVGRGASSARRKSKCKFAFPVGRGWLTLGEGAVQLPVVRVMGGSILGKKCVNHKDGIARGARVLAGGGQPEGTAPTRRDSPYPSVCLQPVRRRSLETTSQLYTTELPGVLSGAMSTLATPHVFRPMIPILERVTTL